jgi:hypothetical protein
LSPMRSCRSASSTADGAKTDWHRLRCSPLLEVSTRFQGCRGFWHRVSAAALAHSYQPYSGPLGPLHFPLNHAPALRQTPATWPAPQAFTRPAKAPRLGVTPISRMATSPNVRKVSSCGCVNCTTNDEQAGRNCAFQSLQFRQQTLLLFRQDPLPNSRQGFGATFDNVAFFVSPFLELAPAMP